MFSLHASKRAPIAQEQSSKRELHPKLGGTQKRCKGLWAQRYVITSPAELKAEYGLHRASSLFDRVSHQMHSAIQV